MNFIVNVLIIVVGFLYAHNLTFLF